MTKKIFTFTFIPTNTKVYYIAKRTPGRPHNLRIYTEPFYSNETKEIRNSLYAFCSKVFAEDKVSYLKENSEIITEDLNDVKYLSEILKIPLVVEVSKYCDIYDTDTEYAEIYYHHKNLIPFNYNIKRTSEY